MLPQEGLTGPLRPLKFCPTLLLTQPHCYFWSDGCKTNAAEKLCVSAVNRKKQIQFIFKDNISQCFNPNNPGRCAKRMHTFLTGLY